MKNWEDFLWKFLILWKKFYRLDFANYKGFSWNRQWGCETCGYGGEGSWKFWLGLKCKECGNAKVILRGDDDF